MTGRAETVRQEVNQDLFLSLELPGATEVTALNTENNPKYSRTEKQSSQIHPGSPQHRYQPPSKDNPFSFYVTRFEEVTQGF